ncbi:MAG: CPBP family intramembrane metalloprotease, partial [Oscillospiraceae bacterium]|nr:CPBP family intramembrane metalloprotease [Oscillospiraceae bacterium]
MSKKKDWICLTVSFLGSMLGLYGVIAFNQYVMMSLPLAGRLVSMIAVYWLAALIPVIAMLVCKDKLSDYGFVKDKIG